MFLDIKGGQETCRNCHSQEVNEDCIPNKKNLSQITLKNNIKGFRWCFYQYTYSSCQYILCVFDQEFNIILSITRSFRRCLSFRFSHENCVQFGLILCMLHVFPSHPNLYFSRLIVFGEEWKLLSCTLCIFTIIMSLSACEV